MIEGSYKPTEAEIEARKKIEQARADTLNKITVMHAYSCGMEVEVRIKGLPDSNWVHAPKPCWDWHTCEFRSRFEIRTN